MRACFYGLMLNFQFFTIIPIRREIPMTNTNMRGLIGTLPLLGLLLGIIYSGITYLLAEATALSPFMLSFIFSLFYIVLTGDIHIYGWIYSCADFLFLCDRC